MIDLCTSGRWEKEKVICRQLCQFYRDNVVLFGLSTEGKHNDAILTKQDVTSLCKNWKYLSLPIQHLNIVVLRLQNIWRLSNFQCNVLRTYIAEKSFY